MHYEDSGAQADPDRGGSKCKVLRWVCSLGLAQRRGGGRAGTYGGPRGVFAVCPGVRCRWLKQAGSRRPARAGQTQDVPGR